MNITLDFNLLIKDFKKKTNLTPAIWDERRIEIGQKLGFRSYECERLFREELSLNRIRVDYVVRNNAILTSNQIELSQPVLVIGRAHEGHDSYRLQIDALDVETVPRYAFIAFLYPEYGKVVVFELEANNYQMIQFNWNWFHTYSRFFVSIGIDLTLTTGTSAIPLGICNVLFPRFKRARDNTDVLGVFEDFQKHPYYPLDKIFQVCSKYIMESKENKPNSDPTIAVGWTVHSYDKLIGHTPSPIWIFDNQYVNSTLAKGFQKIMTKDPPILVARNTLFHHLQNVPNMFSIRDLIELDLCLKEKSVPSELLIVFLRVIGEMLW